jgi:glutaminase
MQERSKNPEKLKSILEEIAEKLLSSDEWGEASDRIPVLKDVDTHQFGIAVHTADGETLGAGAADKPFTIQSISKVFSLTLALEIFGEKVWERLDREPSGDPYNSLVDLERHKGFPRNPFINAGALVINDLLHKATRTDGGHTRVRDLIAELLDGEEVGVDDVVAGSETGSNFGNRAMAFLSKHFGNFHNEVDDVLRDYVQQCAISMSCRQLARAGAYLMVERADPDDEEGLAAARRVRRINALMLTCGLYDGSGNFAYRVGLPAKSGVGGGILAIAPNTASICVWAPGLDDYGNSLLGTQALEELSERMDWSVFGSLCH